MPFIFPLSFLLQNVLSEPFNLVGRKAVRLDIWLGLLWFSVSDGREEEGVRLCGLCSPSRLHWARSTSLRQLFSKFAFIALLPYFFYSWQAGRNWCLWLDPCFPFIPPGPYYLSDFHLGMYQASALLSSLLLIFIDLLILLRQGTSHSLFGNHKGL